MRDDAGMRIVGGVCTVCQLLRRGPSGASMTGQNIKGVIAGNRIRYLDLE